MSVSISSLPYIFIFDVDQCIIGDVKMCSREYDVIKILYKNCKIKKITNVCNDSVNFQEELKNGLLRPDFKKFIDFIKKKYNNVELYIYTNSTFRWTNNALIDNISKASKVKFNKPYFTRENSDRNFKKQLSNIYDTIIKNLTKKYPLLKKNENKELVFEKQLVFIDDKINNLNDYSKKQILCPKYEFRCYYDIREKLMKKYKISAKEFDNNEEILDLFESYDLPLYSKNGSIYQQDRTYQKILDLKQKRETEIINRDIEDTFFADLIKMMKTIKFFTEKTIQNINKQIKDINEDDEESSNEESSEEDSENDDDT